MKRILYFIILIICCGSVSVSAQKPGQYLQVRDLQLKEADGQLLVSIELDIPRKIVKSYQSLTIYPVLQSEGQERVLPAIRLYGKNKDRSFQRMVSLRGEQQVQDPPLYEIPLIKNMSHSFLYSTEVPYESWMVENTVLSFRQQLTGCGRTVRVESYQHIAKVETEPKELFRLQPFVAFVVPGVTVKEHQEEGSAYLDFPTGQSVILPDYRRNPEELRRIRETIEKNRQDPDVKINGIYITGYASPESSSDFNLRLSGARAQALKNYIRRMFGVPEHLLHVHPGGEDWEKLRELVEESYLPYRSQILSIIDNADGYDRKEQQLKALGHPYRQLLTDYFPLLRRVKYQIRYTLRDYSIAEVQSVMNKDPRKLSPYELYQLSENYEQDTAEWREILLLSARLYPQDEISQINAAAIELMKKDFEAAKVYLDRIAYSSLPEAWNNRAVYYLHTGDYTQARELFLRAVEKGLEEAKDNLEQLFQK